jgi:hypothetical protein
MSPAPCRGGRRSCAATLRTTRSSYWPTESSSAPDDLVDPLVRPLLADWENFYVIIGSSAAALTGLQFVVMALIFESPTQKSSDAVAAFGTPTVVHFCQCLVISAVLSAPWPGFIAMSCPLVGIGVGGIVYTLLVIRRARRQTTYHPVAEDWLWHAVVPLLAYAVLLGASLSLLAHAGTALFLIAGVALVLILVGIHNSWDTVAYLAVQQRASRGQ